MSKAYREHKELKKSKVNMRLWCQRPGKQLDDGKPLYFTEQAHKDECDVNLIVAKYDKTGIMSHISRFEAKFGDFTGMDFQNMQNQIRGATEMFNQLPAEIRKRFDNSPGMLLEFMEDPNNRDEAIELGLIHGDTDPTKDGLGEHVKEGIDTDPNKEKPVEEPKPA